MSTRGQPVDPSTQMEGMDRQTKVNMAVTQQRGATKAGLVSMSTLKNKSQVDIGQHQLIRKSLTNENNQVNGVLQAGSNTNDDTDEKERLDELRFQKDFQHLNGKQLVSYRSSSISNTSSLVSNIDGVNSEDGRPGQHKSLKTRPGLADNIINDDDDNHDSDSDDKSLSEYMFSDDMQKTQDDNERFLKNVVTDED